MHHAHRITVSLFAVLALLLSGCIGSSDNAAPSLSDESSPRLVGTAPEDAPQPGGGDGDQGPNGLPGEIATEASLLTFTPGHYIATNAFDWQRQELMLQAATRPGVKGVVVRYLWADLEQSLGNYDLSVIESDLTLMADHGKQLIARIEDKSFKPDVIPVPPYLRDHFTLPHNNPNGGYVTKRWLPFVTERMAALTEMLGARFDGHPNFEGITFEESAPGLTQAMRTEHGYSPEAYRDETIRMLKNTRAHFPRSQIFWSMNFFPGRQSYIGDIAEAAVPLRIVMGGPDVLPDNEPLVRLTYPYYEQFRDRMVLFGSLQYSSYRHVHADPSAPTRFWTMDELFRFARDRLHVSYIFWTQQLSSAPPDSYNWTHALPVIRDNPDFN